MVNNFKNEFWKEQEDVDININIDDSSDIKWIFYMVVVIFFVGVFLYLLIDSILWRCWGLNFYYILGSLIGSVISIMYVNKKTREL